jgi:hypothetical protein
VDFNQLMSRLVLRPERGYAVRVDHPQGHHQFWSLCRTYDHAVVRARRIRAQLGPWGDVYSIVEMSRSDFDRHIGYVCDAPICPMAA